MSSKTNNPKQETTMDAMSKRFSLIELGDAPAADTISTSTPAPTPVVAAPPVPAEPVRSANDGWSGPGVSPAGKARAQADEDAAIAAGFAPKPPLYEIGRLVNNWGVENMAKSQTDYAQMASVDEACGHLQNIVTAEDRQDHKVSVPNLHMLDNGELHTAGNGTYPMSRRALQGLCGFVTPGGAGYLGECDSTLRAYNMNKWFAKGFRLDRRATTSQLKEWQVEVDRAEKFSTTSPDRPDDILVTKDVTLRTRGPKDDRELFAVVGPNYGEHDIDKIAGQIMEGVPSDARCKVIYDGYKARIDVLFHTDIAPENAVAGEIFKAGVCITTADDGSGSIKISAQMWRNLCLNLFIIDNAKEPVMSRRHFGQGISEAVSDGITAAQAKIGHFMKQWNKASIENVCERYNVDNADTILRALAFNKVVHVSGVKKTEMYERLRRAWEKEPGYSRTAFVNAVTRAAHEEPWQRWTDEEDLERTGGRLLYAKVWNVDITPEQAATFGDAR